MWVVFVFLFYFLLVQISAAIPPLQGHPCHAGPSAALDIMNKRVLEH